MLHTNHAMSVGHIDMSFRLDISSVIPPPVNNADFKEHTILHSSRKPSQMTMMGFKLRLFQLSNRICRQLSEHIDVTSLNVFNDEVAAEQKQWDAVFLLDGEPSILDTSSYAHWCILQLYAHQLFLLLHRPFCRGCDNSCFLPSSRIKCLTSGAALIDIHRKFLELPRLRAYRWYAYGMTGLYAIHGAVVLALCLLEGNTENWDTAPYFAIFIETVTRIEKLRCHSSISAKAYPMLCQLKYDFGPL